MTSREHGIREKLIAAFNLLAQLARRVLGLHNGTVTYPINVTTIWELEVAWTRNVQHVVRSTGLGPEAEARMNTALGDLATRLERAVAEKGDATRLSNEIIAFRDRWVGWARVVAATEATRLASETALDGDAARRPGATKTWVTSLDEKVRSSHREADGVEIPVAGTFHLDSGPVRYPGDPLGPPSEVVNCRCGLRIKPGREA